MHGLDQLKTDQLNAIESMQAQRDNAPANYAALLDPNRAPEAGDADRLRQLMATLGLSLADVERHLEARRLAGDLADLERRIAKVAAEREVAGRELIEASERFRQIESAWREERSELMLRGKQLEFASDSLSRERDRLHDLRRRFPVAFGVADEGSVDAG